MKKLLAQFTKPEPIEAKIVPNKQPTLTGFPYRIALVGEAPGRDEVEQGEPFVGASGRFLSTLLGKANIVREACLIGNICQHRPPNNDIELFALDGPEITTGLDALRRDLDLFKPNVCVLLGKTALRVALGIDKIGDWRGSLFLGTTEPFSKLKCLASYHPAACLRQYEWTTLLMFDLKKAFREGHFPDLHIPSRALLVNLTASEIVDQCEQIRRNQKPVATDIEGGLDSMSCISFATSSDYSFTIPLAKLDGTSFWPSTEDEVRVWQAFVGVLEDLNVPKILQNSLYDRFVLQYGYNVILRNTVDDTMLKFHEAYCELEKSLGFQASILTDQPFYKSDRKSDDQDTFYRYCAMDSAITFEINQKLDGILDAGQREHYKFNVAMLNPLLFMELRGIRYDTKLAKERLAQVNHAIYELQADLDFLAMFGINPKMDRQTLMNQARDICCYKRDRTQPKAEYIDDFDLVMRILLGEAELTKHQIGYINIALGLSMNVKSDSFKTYLYDVLKLPEQINPKTGSRTTDYLALLKLSKKSDHPSLRLAIEISGLRTRAQMLAIHADRDRRIRCGYNVVGIETGRLTCYTSPSGSGYNLQTIPSDDLLYSEGHPLRKGMRDLFVADEGHLLIQCDLKGSDGWTIGANLNALGDSTMLDDLRFGIKPASRICYMLRHGNSSLAGKQRDEVKELLKEIKKEDYDYFMCKIGIWGVCYLMGVDLLANQILEESQGRIIMSRSDVTAFRNAILVGYKIKLWHDATTRRLAKKPILECDGGRRRRFYGRREDILGQALADEPQYCTTRATNMAALKIWTDPENRLEGNKLRCELLHQVHDALLLQVKEQDIQWATIKLKTWFDNPMRIAGQLITIPFAGEYGKSWGNLNNEVT